MLYPPSRPARHGRVALLGAVALLALGACDLGQYDGGFAADGGVGEGGGGGGGGGGGPLPDASYPLGCNASCHGDEANPAPPVNLAGESGPSAAGVGAHRNHLDVTSTWHRVVRCEDCHVVPASLTAPGHMDDGDDTAELTFSSLAGAGGASPQWTGSACSNTYCHGATLTGGALTEPTWTTVDGSQDACGNCHGFPPPPPHDASEDCGACHPTVQRGGTAFLDPDSHIDGVLDVGEGLECDSCHGSDGVSAPPADLDGNSARTAAGVGAHRQHLGTSTWRREMYCSQCHVVPAEVGAAGHLDGDDVAELTFDVFNPAATYDRAASRCDNLYCHGNGRASNGSITWTSDPTLGCSSCHATTAGGATGLQGDHRKHFNEGAGDCVECHQAVVNLAMDVVAPELHINGVRDIQFRQGGTWDPATRRCSGLACHGAETW